MARFKKNNDSIYDSLAQAYEAASISKITRYYPKHHKFEHTDIQQPVRTSQDNPKIKQSIKYFLFNEIH